MFCFDRRCRGAWPLAASLSLSPDASYLASEASTSIDQPNTPTTVSTLASSPASGLSERVPESSFKAPVQPVGVQYVRKQCKYSRYELWPKYIVPTGKVPMIRRTANPLNPGVRSWQVVVLPQCNMYLKEMLPSICSRATTMTKKKLSPGRESYRKKGVRGNICSGENTFKKKQV